MKLLRILRNIAFVILGLLLIAAGIVYFKKDALIRSAVNSAEESMALKIDYKDAGIALFSTFPNVGISFDSLVVHDPDKADGKLADIGGLTLGINFWSLFSDEGYELKEIILNRPHLQFICRKDSTCNYDVLMQTDAQPEDTTIEESSMRFSIEEFTVHDGKISYVDSISAMVVNASKWNFNLSGNYRDDILTADLDQDQFILDYISDGIHYMDSVNIAGGGGVNYNTVDGKIGISENQWRFNELKIDLNGFVQMLEEGYDMDLSLNLPSNEFKPLLSLIPAVYRTDFDNVKANGQFSLEGSIKGKLNTETEVYPALLLNSSVSNGSVQYPDLPQAITDINMKADIRKEEGGLDLLKVNIESYRMQMGSDSKINGSLFLRNLISNPYAAGELNANASLASLNEVLPLEDVQKLAGQIDLNLNFDLHTNDLVDKQYNKISLNGKGTVNSLVYKSTDQPEISLKSMNASIRPQGISADATAIKAGSSEIRTLNAETGSLGAYFSENDAFPVSFKLEAGLINVNEWLYDEETESEDEELSTSYDLDAYALDWEVVIDELIYDVYELKDVVSTGNMRNGLIELSSSSFNYEGSPLRLNGSLDQVAEYMDGKKSLQAKLELSGGRFDLWKYMNSEPEDPNANTGETDYYTLPRDISLQLGYTLEGIDYDQINFNHVRGSLQMNNGNLDFTSTNLDGMGGKLNIEGVFKTQENTAPYYDFNVAMQSMQFSNTFKSFITVQKIAPLLGKLQGVFDARLSTAGTLDKELFPQIKGLDAQGFIATKNVTLESYEPLARIDQVAGTNFSTDFPLDNTKNWFAIEDGAVVIEPFNFDIKQYQWTLEGRHEIGGEMNYLFTGPIPVEDIKKSPAGSKIVNEANRILNQIPLTSDYSLEKIDVTIALSGTRTNPKVNLRLANDFEAQLKDRIRTQIAEGKEKVKDEINEEIEDIKDDVEEKAKKKVKEIMTGQKDTSQTDPVDSLKKKGEEKINEAKKKLQKWNPFKNKNG